MTIKSEKRACKDHLKVFEFKMKWPRLKKSVANCTKIQFSYVIRVSTVTFFIKRCY